MWLSQCRYATGDREGRKSEQTVEISLLNSCGPVGDIEGEGRRDEIVELRVVFVGRLRSPTPE